MREIYQWILNCFVLTMVVLMIALSLPDGEILTGMYLVYAGWVIGLFCLFIFLGAKSRRVKLVSGAIAGIHALFYLAVFLFFLSSPVSLPGIL
ncbi:hypothetical protein ACMXYN_09630 [Neptuniibacter sp. PT8_73]|uniref:hypothetical protein n=1 Tax=Neptuniibacter sp. PT8_73 TaxID=3398206 RepID=UPI0039F5CC82